MNFRKPICPHGHDKRIVGVSANNWCRACKRISDPRYVKKRASHVFIEPICINGHDKRIVGSRVNGGCAECHRIRNRKWRKAHAKPKPLAIPNLRLVRKDLGLSAQQIVDETGISLSALYKIETGTNRATPENARRILSVIAPRLSERKWEELA